MQHKKLLDECQRRAEQAREALDGKRAGGSYRNGYDIGYLLGTAHAYEAVPGILFEGAESPEGEDG